jgi:hypothetical protein
LSRLVLPRYGEDALTELLPSVLGAMGVIGEDDVLGLPTGRRYCVLLIDGLGWNLLRAHPVEAPYLNSLTGRAITAGIPTTTATSLTSVGTGLAPGRHGVVGYTSRKPGTANGLLNSLKWDKTVDARAYQPHPTVFERAARAGVTATVLGKREFRNSGLTTLGLRSPNYRPADSLGQRVAAAADALTADRSLVYVYDSDLDYTGHQEGCDSPAWRYQLVMLDRFAEELSSALPADAVLVVTADHGMVDVPLGDRVDVDDIPALRAGVALVAGEARFRHVYAADGAAADVLAAWTELLADRADVRSREQAIADGWFGAVEKRVQDRIGDVVAAVNTRSAIERRSVFPIEAKLIGLHGAMTEDEMLVPLLIESAGTER